MRKSLPPLSVRDVAELLERSPRSRDAILVGGQALNVWAVHYGLATQTAAVSDDIDFFGTRADAIAAGLDWGGDVNMPSLDDHTPNAAVVLVEIHDSKRGIDFLDSILGVEAEELRRWAGLVRGRDYSFRVLHPLHVLQSQLENVYGALKRRDEEVGQYYVGRVKLSVQVVASAVEEMLEAKRTRDALNAAERVARIARSRPGLEAHRRDGIEVLAGIPIHRGWPGKFLDQRLAQIRAGVEAQLKKYGARAERKPTR